MKNVELFKNTFAAAAENERAAKEQAIEKIAAAQSDEEKSEFSKVAKRSATHERFNEALANMSEKALAALSKYKVDASALAQQSRELKKRSIAILEALAHSQRVDDKALDAVLQRLAAKDDHTLTIAQIQREMMHETDTQASYFKNCALFYKFAQYSKADKSLSFDYSAAVLRDLIALYK